MFGMSISGGNVRKCGTGEGPCSLNNSDVRQFQHSHDTSRQRHRCVIPEAVIQFRCS